ncbi:hypothetical protein [Nocardioides piscis]|uniref:Uncharacterized protein n=1 Tax=Nocardioides piscis TaxID=2714938 RepID=A0A6G7YBY6_9ACTN|nr:hypothetical protein [Nocardioides piscis]QIK74332.1 hypothetical protein G7071_01620 [Nocardioides piscis]
MNEHEEPSTRLSISPPLDEGEVMFLAGFSREPVPGHGGHGPDEQDRGGGGRPARIWPGQPAAPSPWVPCRGGCCLVLAAPRPGITVAGQWLRFLLEEFLPQPGRLSGWVLVVGTPGRRPGLLMVERGDVFEGQLGDSLGWSG